MPSARFVRRALTLAGVAGLTLGATLPASAAGTHAATPGWRVVSKLGPSEGDWSTGFTAVSATDAWSTWTAVGNNDVEHWNGRTWQRVSVPANLISRVAGRASIGASSATGLWVFGAIGSVVRYSGSKWRLQTIPKWAVHFNLSGGTTVTPAVFSPTNVWAFSLGWDKPTNPDHYAAHYNGRVWTKVEMPAVPYAVSVVSPTDIWADGPSPQNISRWVLMHWDGKNWSTLPMPKVSVPKGDTAQFGDLLGAGPANAWFVADIETPSTTAKIELLHWTGRSWSNVAIKYPTTGMEIAPDGDGGLWAVAWGPGPAYTQHFDHLINGHWFQYAVPGGVDIQPPNLIWIPGTRSMWATGDLFDKNVVYGTTLKYGA